jgi:hypothetical protein
VVTDVKLSLRNCRQGWSFGWPASFEDCAATIPMVVAPKTAIPIAMAAMNLLMLRGMSAYIYRAKVALFRGLAGFRFSRMGRAVRAGWIAALVPNVVRVPSSECNGKGHGTTLTADDIPN